MKTAGGQHGRGRVPSSPVPAVLTKVSCVREADVVLDISRHAQKSELPPHSHTVHRRVVWTSSSFFFLHSAQKVALISVHAAAEVDGNARVACVASRHIGVCDVETEHANGCCLHDHFGSSWNTFLFGSTWRSSRGSQHRIDYIQTLAGVVCLSVSLRLPWFRFGFLWLD